MSQQPCLHCVALVRASDLVGGGYSTVRGEMLTVSVSDPTLCEILTHTAVLVSRVVRRAGSRASQLLVPLVTF